MNSLRSALLLLALAAPAAAQTPSSDAEDASKKIKCPGYKSGVGMRQKNFRLGFESCRGLSMPCLPIETAPYETYAGSCMEDAKCKKQYEKHEDLAVIADWCIEQCKAREESTGHFYNTATFESEKGEFPFGLGECSCGRGLQAVEENNKEGEYTCAYAPYPGETGKTHANGCPAQAFDFGPDGGCGCYDDEDFELDGPWGVDDGILTCDMIANDKKPLEVDDKEWADACDQTDVADDTPGANNAFKACATTCQSDSTTWINRPVGPGEETKNCDWVAKNPVGRCGKKSRDGVIAHKACQKACGCRASRPFVVATWGKTGDAKTTALELYEKGEVAEDEVAVRVPTLVAICVMAGVALGGLGALVASKTKAKPADEAQPLIALEKA